MILASPRRHRALRGALSPSSLASIRARQPQLPFKYLRRNYLAANLDRGERAQILRHHYAFAAGVLKPAALRRLAEDGLLLWHTDGPAAHEIRLVLAAPVDNEGEFALHYCAEDKVVGILAFSFAPAALFGCDGDTVPLISRIQSLDDGPLLRRVAKQHHDIAPRFALAAALQGVASSLGLHAIAAVGLTNQVAFKSDREAPSAESYDIFYQALSGRQGRPGFFTLDVPFPEKDIAQVSSAHRRRSKRKRAARQAVAAAAEDAMAAQRRRDDDAAGTGRSAVMETLADGNEALAARRTERPITITEQG